MKKAYIKGFKAANKGAYGGSNPYNNLKQYAQWEKGWITGFIDKDLLGKARRRIPKSF